MGAMKGQVVGVGEVAVAVARMMERREADARMLGRLKLMR